MSKQYTSKEVLDVMRKVSLMSLAVSDKNNQPQSHMMLFAIEDDFTMYFATIRNSGKHKAIQDNNRVGISVWSDREMLVQIQAEVYEVEANKALDILDKLADAATDIVNFWPPLLQIMKLDYVVYKTKPKTIRALDLSNENISVHTTMFTNVGAQL